MRICAKTSMAHKHTGSDASATLHRDSRTTKDASNSNDDRGEKSSLSIYQTWNWFEAIRQSSAFSSQRNHSDIQWRCRWLSSSLCVVCLCNKHIRRLLEYTIICCSAKCNRISIDTIVCGGRYAGVYRSGISEFQIYFPSLTPSVFCRGNNSRWIGHNWRIFLGKNSLIRVDFPIASSDSRQEIQHITLSFRALCLLPTNARQVYRILYLSTEVFN